MRAPQQRRPRRFPQAYLSSMSLGPNLRALREARGLKAVDVARHLGLSRSAYSKTENGQRGVTVPELRAAAELFACTMDDIAGYRDGDTPPPPISTPVYADADAHEQARLIAALDPEDRAALHRIVDRMVASQRLRKFLDENVREAA